MNNLVEELNIRDGLHGVLTIRDNKGNIILKAPNTIVNDGRRLVLSIFGKGITINNNGDTITLDADLAKYPSSDSTKVIFPLIYFKRNGSQRTSREMTAADAGVNNISEGKVLAQASNMKFSYSDISISINYILSLETTTETLTFDSIIFAFTDGAGELKMFSRICVDTTYLLPNSSYNLEYKIYF